MFCSQTVWFVIIIKMAFTFRFLLGKLPDDDIVPIEQYVEDKDYPIEKHMVDTDDGYRLLYHRIPHGKYNRHTAHRYPVLLVHGIVQSSALYLAMDDGLAYMLADAGFDVWLANSRGNVYSRNHHHLDPDKDAEFWNFSFDEMGRFDLKAGIDYILKETSRSSLGYMGFSLGTAMFWVLGSYWPSYMEKVDVMVALAPIARPHISYTITNKGTARALSVAMKSLEFFHFYEFRPYNKKEAIIIKKNCLRRQNNFLCRKLLGTLTGLNPKMLNYDNTLEATMYMPAGTSIKTLRHLLQIGSTGVFARYSQGETLQPSIYDLTGITCPVFFVSGDKDIFSVTEDVQWLARQLPKPVKFLFHEQVKSFSHLDFFYSNNIREVLYDRLVQFITDIVYPSKDKNNMEA